MIDLDHLEKLHAEATQGEWREYQPHDHLADGIAAGGEGGYFIETTAPDARAIAATHNALPALIAEVKALRANNERLKGVVAKDGNLQEFADADQALWHAEQELAVLRDVEKEARELARWDWLPLLLEDANTEDVRSGVKSLCAALAKVSR